MWYLFSGSFQSWERVWWEERYLQITTKGKRVNLADGQRVRVDRLRIELTSFKFQIRTLMGGGIILCTTLLTGWMCTGITHYKARRTSQHLSAAFPKLIHINVYIVINVQRRRFLYFLHTYGSWVSYLQERKGKRRQLKLI